MIDREAAQSLVERFLSTLEPKYGSGWAIADEKTLELDEGWMFFWTLKKPIMQGGKRPKLVGNYPILVDKTDGSLYAWTMLESLDRFSERLRNNKTTLPRLNPEEG